MMATSSAMHRLRLCANLTWLFDELPFLDRFEAAARAGFEGVEILSPYDHPVAELRTRLQGTGLQQVLINSPSGDRAGGERGMACLPGRQAEFRASMHQALEYATALGCGTVHVMAGIRPDTLPYDTAAALYAVNLSWACELAASAGVQLAIEAINQRDIPGYFLRTQEQAANVIQALDQDCLGLQLDFYHCQMAQGDLSRRLETFLPLIRHLQVADVPGRHEPGTGEINWNHLFRRIDELGYRGWIGCEYKPLTTTEAGLGWREQRQVKSS
jgi:hydroxypyruvate isomerase